MSPAHAWRQGSSRWTYEGFDELFQRLLPATLFLFLRFYIVFIFVCELIDHFHNVDYDVHVFVAEQTD